MKPSKNYQQAADIARRTSFILLVLLIISFLISHLMVGVDPVFRILVSCLPLIIFIPGMLQGRRRTASLLCFALLLYFMALVPKLFIPGNLLSDIITTGLVTTLFISCMMYSTWQYRADLARLESSGELTENGEGKLANLKGKPITTT